MSQTALQLFDPDDPDDRPKPSWSLWRLFNDRYRPRRLDSHRRKDGTVQKYLDFFKKWRQATNDPAIARLERPSDGPKLIAAFTAFLDLPYRRGPFSPQRRLADKTREGYLRILQQMLRYAWRKKLLVRPPKVPKMQAETQRRKPFSIVSARAMWVAALSMPWPAERKRRKQTSRGALPPAAVWWRAFIAIAYYTGLRTGDIFALTWKQLLPADDEEPAKFVLKSRKTGKRVEKALHGDLVAALEELRAASSRSAADDPILGLPFDHGTFLRQHRRLCELAGLPKAKWQSPHAWRRTHAQQIAETGDDQRREEARQALDHSSAQTTADHYADFLPISIRLIARLVVGAGA